MTRGNSRPHRHRSNIVWISMLWTISIGAYWSTQPIGAADLETDDSFTWGSHAFDMGGNNDDLAKAVVVQADGKIVIAGSIQRSATDWDIGLVRLQPDGTLDHSFGFLGKQILAIDQGGSLRDEAWALALHQGGILVAGQADTGPGGGIDMVVCRLLITGVLDLNFGANGCELIAFDLGGGNHDWGLSLAVQPDGKIVVAGAAERSAAGDLDFAVARLLGNGDLDHNFGLLGRSVVAFDVSNPGWDLAWDVVLQPDGRILLVGTATPGVGVARLTTSGLLDPSFAGDGTLAFSYAPGSNDQAFAGFVDPTGRLIIGGSSINPMHPTLSTEWAMARLLSDGSFDTTFGDNGRYVEGWFDSNEIQDVVVANNGRIYIAGDGGNSATACTFRPPPAAELCESLVQQPSVFQALAFAPGNKLVAVGAAINGSGHFDFYVHGFVIGRAFTDGFESGDTQRWSQTVGGS